MPTMPNTIPIFGGENFIENGLIIIKACVICVKNYILIKFQILILICENGGWIKQSAVQRQSLVKMI